MDIGVFLGMFIIGLTVGSFLNALVFRLGSAESVLWGRSHCQTCQHTLEWHELIPVASFIVLGGRCRTCHGVISLQYPVVELLTGIVFLFVYGAYKNIFFPASSFAAIPDASGFFWFLFGLVFFLSASTLLLAIAIYDFRTSLIPPVLFLPFFGLGILGQLVDFFAGKPFRSIEMAAVAALAAFLFFAAFWFFSKGRAMGFGDAELVAAVFLFLGPAKGVIAALLSFWSGAIFGIMLILFGRARLTSRMPFGPFIVFGAFIALFFGGEIVRVYFSLLM